MKFTSILLLFIIFNLTTKAQSGFQFESNKNKVVIPFKFINNLIFIPIYVNGIELNFLLDTGVDETILLSLEDKEGVNFFNVVKIKLKGLGSDDAIEGLKSTNNILAINGFKDSNHDLYIVLDQSFNFSSHIGIPVNGIIGYNFFKNNLIEINYDSKKIIVHKDNKKIRNRISKKFKNVPITIEKRKPYAIANITFESNTFLAKLLIDSGNSDALWLFENKLNKFQIPKKNFNDYLGKGFSGDINGKRAKVLNFKLSKFDFFEPIIAFPDSLSTKSVTMVKDRIGSIGGEILKRFTVIFDYNNEQLFLKKNSYFDSKFDYNMSGIEIQNDGLQWVQETVPLHTVLIDNSINIKSENGQNNFKYKFSLKPIYTISNIREGSPADICGLKKGDIILSINNTEGFRYSLQQINNLLKKEEGMWLYFEIERNNQKLKFKFQLKSIL